MNKGKSAWKVWLAVLSILLTVFVWSRGLQESFSRPSVSPQLSLHQKELSVLAENAFPSALKSSILGVNPQQSLKDSLIEIPLDQISDRNRIIIASLENSIEKRSFFLDVPFTKASFQNIKEELLNESSAKVFQISSLEESDDFINDPLLRQLICTAMGGEDSICIDKKIAKNVSIRLIISQFLPFIAFICGSLLLLRQMWILYRNKAIILPKVIALPLSLIDMVLLVAGGFVVLGEVLVPAIVLPIASSFTQNLAQPIGDSVKVLIGYSAMTLPPLIILRRQIISLDKIDKPINGWLQWRLKPFWKAIFSALNGWLMVMPLVLGVSWLANSLFGDQGGSNPLLELVLNSQDRLALGLLVLTTVVFAPLFEELIFRGVLLPVLAKRFGSFLGVIFSALFFAIAHLSVGELAPLFVLGIGLGLLRLSSARLLPCVLMHSFWNGVTFVSLLLLGV